MFSLKQNNIAAVLLCKRLAMSFVFLALFFFTATCSDQGCIEADDFGEYETQTLEVIANNSSENCTYDASKSLTDSDQGSGLRPCFTSGNVTIYNENGDLQTSDKGCMGLAGPAFKNLCVNQCIANCTASIGTGDSASSEPGWLPTGQKTGDTNSGVTIRPNSLVYIRAVGNIRLGDKLPYPDFFVRTDESGLQSKTANWNNQVLDVKTGKSLNVFFSGKISDDSLINGGTTKVGQVGAGNASTIDSKVYNASRRLATYIIPAPQGYIYDRTQTVEKARYINIPLLPDPNMWKCVYSGSDFKQSTCSNGSYREGGYINVDDILTLGTFPISSEALTSTLGTYGGMIRWASDGSAPLSYDPFAASSISCDNPANCSSANIDPTKGRLVGDLSVGDVEVGAPISGVVSFKELLLPTVASCNDNIQVVIKDARGNDLYYFDGGVNHEAVIPVTSIGWSSKHIPIESGQKIVIRSRPAAGNYSYGATTVSCNRALAMKFSPYKDIQIDRSGFVSLATIGGSAESNCDIDARIINPTGRRVSSDTAISPDFYEYGDFSSIGLDPFDNYSVPVLTSTKNWLAESSGTITSNASTKVFVRKGQVIRFSPKSWNGTWNSVNGGTRECGIGMAIRIEPRPAFLCRGYGQTEVANPACTQKYNASTGALIGCSEVAMECTDPSNSTYYCPNQDPVTGCLRPLTCADGVAGGLPDNVPPIPKNTRYNCALGTAPTCTISSTSGGATYTQAMCNACSSLRKLRAEQSPYQSISGVVQCYDLESYTGKVGNIPNNGTITNDALARGAKILPPFSSELGYGNFSNFSSASKVDKDFNSNIIFQINQPITVGQNGRMTFMFLDGIDFYKNFNSYYGDNIPAPTPNYNGSNGFKVSLSSALEFANGEWLEAKLCQERADDAVSCKRLALNSNALFPNQPKIVELNEPGSGNLLPVSKTPFYFDTAGNIIRTQSPGAVDCTNTFVNDTYYCHTDKTVDQSKIRITFKIKDPETPNCAINDPSNPAPTNPDGVIMSNTRFRPSDCVVGNPTADASIPKNGITVADGATTICQPNSKAGTFCLPADDVGLNTDGSKKVCTKEFRCVSKYANNSGKYYVAVKVKTPGSNISNIVNQVIDPVVEVMDGNKDHTKIGQAERIYKLIIADPRYQAILSICLVVMFTFYGLGYLIGVTEAGISDIINKLVKISLIYLFVGPEGWDWFNKIVVKFFKDGTDYLAFLMASSFDNSPELANAIQNSEFYDKSVLFNSVDKVFGIFFSATVQKKISALLFASIFGWAYLILIYYGMLLYVYAVGNAVLLYLTSQVFISILFVLGPLFFVFTLFSQTKEMFDKWLSQLISFSLQQIFLLTTLAFFNMMMYEVIKMVLGYKICWDEVWTINIITRITLMSFWTIASLPPRVNAQSDAGNIGNPDGIPSFFTILFLWVIADLMLKFVDFMTNMAASISGGLKASQLASGIKASLGAVGKMVSAPAKELWDKTAGAKMRELDAHYFDSGKLADERRKQKEQENAQMASHKKAFVSAGDQAVKEHLRKNAAELFAPGVTKEQRDKELTKVRDEAMAKEGKKRGLTDDQINKVKNDKGFKYEGSNVLAGGWQAMKQGLTASGSFKTSIGERKVNSELSAKDAREALKNTDSVGREQFLKAVASGDVSVKKSGWEGFKDKAKTAGKVAAGVATGGLAPAAMALSKYAKDAAEYKEAREQLVSEGVVPKMALGVYSALPSEMKDKIRARRDVNRAQKDDGAKKRPSANTEAKLRIESQMLDEKESGGEGEFVRDQDSAAAMGIGRERDLFALMKRGDVAKQIKKERAALSKTELLSRRDQAKANLVSAEEEYDKYDDDVETTKNDPEYKEKEHLMTQCRGKIADPKLSREERNEARKTLSTLKKDPEFTAKVTKLKKDIVSRNQAYNKAQNYGKAVESLEIQVAEMEGASSGPVVTIKDPYDDGDDNKGKDSKDGDA